MVEICIIFCDKDFFNLTKLIISIYQKIKIPFLIRAWDNREHNTDELPKFDNVTYYNIGKGNIYQFKARQKLAQYVDDNNYVWFVDGDDDVEEINELPHLDCDMVLFACNMLYKGTVHYTESNTKSTLTINNAMWSRWFKGSLLKKAVSQIPENLDCTASEDQIISLLCYINNNKKIQKVNIPIYFYNTNNSYCMVEDCSDNYISFENCSRGFVDAKNFIKTLLTEEEYKEYLIGSYCYWVKQKLMKTKDEEVASEMLEKIKDFFTQEEKDYIYYNQAIFDKDLENFNRALAVLSPNPRYKTVKYTYEDGHVEEIKELIKI